MTSRRLRRMLAAAAVAALAGINLWTQFGFVAATAREGGGNRLLLERLGALRAAGDARPVMVDAGDPSFPGVIALSTRGRPTILMSGFSSFGVEGFALELQAAMVSPLKRWLLPLGDFGIPALLGRIEAARHGHAFALPSVPGGTLKFHQVAPTGVATDDAIVIAPAADQSVVNASLTRPPSGRFHVVEARALRNYLALVDSSQGRVITVGGLDRIAMWQREPDPVNAGGGMQAVGRVMLFRVVNPVPGSRLLFDFSSGALSQLGRRIPPATVTGDGTQPLGLVGYGAARMLSDPLNPQVIGDASYIAIDLGVEATRFSSEARRGIAAWFNRALNVDPRWLAGMVRNISLLTPQEADALEPPAAVARFPAGLFAPGLLFSGVYEDGWMGDVAQFRLRLPAGSRAVRITGMVVRFGPRREAVEATVRVDGVPVLHQRVAAGAFTLTAALPESRAARLIEIGMAPAAALPGPDDRRVASAQLRSVELLEQP